MKISIESKMAAARVVIFGTETVRFLRLPRHERHDVVHDELDGLLLKSERSVQRLELACEFHKHVEQALGRHGVERTSGQLALDGLQLFGERFYPPFRSHAVLLPRRLKLNLPHVAEVVFQVLAP